MPTKPDAKTALAPKISPEQAKTYFERFKRYAQYWRLIVLSIALLLILPIVFETPHPTVRINGVTFDAEIVDTPQLRQQGLSGRSKIEVEQVMLFDFKTAGKHCMWMKDMKFPIDILWFSSEQKLVHLKHNVAPETFPENFCPPVNAQYVVEMKSGAAGLYGIREGQELHITYP